MVAQFADQTTFGVAEGLAENIVPGLPHELEQRGRVPFGNRLLRVQAVLAHEAAGFGRSAVFVSARELALDERAEPAL